MDENLKEIVGFEGIYAVSDQGRIYRISPLKPSPLKPSKSQAYQLVSLSKHNKRQTKRIHKIVARAFLGEVPEGMEINHKNGDKFDNRLSNLEYISRLENMNHFKSIGLFRKRSPSTPIATAVEIRKCKADGMSYAEISKKFGVSTGVAFNIVKNKTRCAR